MPLGDRLERRAIEALAGRRAELERLEVFALGDEPLVMHIQGIPGIGKTHLLSALAQLSAEGAFSLCGWTPAGASLPQRPCVERSAGKSVPRSPKIPRSWRPVCRTGPSELCWCSTVTNLSVCLTLG